MSWLYKIRQKSLDQKRIIALVVSLVITGFVSVIWLVGVMATNSFDTRKEQATASNPWHDLIDTLTPVLKRNTGENQ